MTCARSVQQNSSTSTKLLPYSRQADVEAFKFRLPDISTSPYLAKGFQQPHDVAVIERSQGLVLSKTVFRHTDLRISVEHAFERSNLTRRLVQRFDNLLQGTHVVPLF